MLVDFGPAGSRVQARGVMMSKIPSAIRSCGCRALVDVSGNTCDGELRILSDRGLDVSITKIMRANVAERLGGPEVLQIKHVLRPVAGASLDWSVP